MGTPYGTKPMRRATMVLHSFSASSDAIGSPRQSKRAVAPAAPASGAGALRGVTAALLESSRWQEGPCRRPPGLVMIGPKLVRSISRRIGACLAARFPAGRCRSGPVAVRLAQIRCPATGATSAEARAGFWSASGLCCLPERSSRSYVLAAAVCAAGLGCAALWCNWARGGAPGSQVR